MSDLLATPQGNGLAIVGKRGLSGMMSEGGIHAHRLLRNRGTTATDGAHSHLYLIEGAFYATEWDGEASHRIEEGARRSEVGGEHRHRIVIPGTGVLNTEMDGEHDHDLVVEITAFDGTHDHVLDVAGRRITSLSPAEFAELFPQSTMDDGFDDMMKAEEMLRQLAKPQHGLVVSSLDEAGAILSGEKTMLVKQTDLDVDGRNVYMLCGNMALGIWKLHAPERVDGVTLDGYGAQTGIRSDERREQWSDDTEFYLYNIDVVKVFDQPIIVEGAEPGVFAVQDVTPTREADAVTKAEWQMAKMALSRAQSKLVKVRHPRKGDVEKAPLSRASINDLPDKSFLFIAAGGKKDVEGKTVPRSLRKLPVLDANGKVDLPRLRNALARISQTKAPGLDDAKRKKLRARAERLLAEEKERRGTVKMMSEIRLLKSDREDAEEERFVLGIVLVPEEEDAQGDIYSAEEVRKAAHYFLENDGETGLMHKEMLGDQVKIVENFLMPVDGEIDGVQVKKGTWLQGLHILADKLWKAVKSGELTGLSIGGSAFRDPEAA